MGYIISKVNGVDVEDMGFEECLDIIDEASTPHEIEFRRYDFRQDLLTGVWYSLQDLRLKG